MVDDLEDVKELDLDQILSSSTTAAPVQEAPKQEDKPSEPKKAEAPKAVASGGSSDRSSIDEQIHHSEVLISPSAGFYMRTYLISPSELTGSGRRGLIQKQDVLDFVQANNITKGSRASAPKAPAKKPPTKQPAASKTSSPSSNDPFKQSWSDLAVGGDFAQVAKAMYN